MTPSFRYWAMYVSPEPDPSDFANAIRARGGQWRPLVVKPERAAEAARAIQPALVVLDSRLPNFQDVAESMRSHTTTIISDREFSH